MAKSQFLLNYIGYFCKQLQKSARSDFLPYLPMYWTEVLENRCGIYFKNFFYHTDFHEFLKNPKIDPLRKEKKSQTRKKNTKIGQNAANPVFFFTLHITSERTYNFLLIPQSTLTNQSDPGYFRRLHHRGFSLRNFHAER